ncbi:MAG: hypothetical protein QOK88_03965, partial [Nitrososphaeraceae archaeon]|nr:hypothetical protein [Nitrososphaeraceae archaeon]
MDLISKTAIMSIMFVFMTAFFSVNYGVAQDLQVLQPSSPSTTGPGMSIDNSVASSNTTTSNTAGPIQDRVTIGSFGDDR